ncbi:uncharacterized protein K452DRAFT_323232 [Aplosporella prunicola CBS 121167]|uniref:Uncharacterized protein n=1 Tax=Aplosporella prunicola CBS 121167 TaxID=1176127 RepID=A0A6A6ATS6_9PEZI|nr:uncharacterized protein K452DRAFT_323232 [Aplosporella prunicola CBS 121167]KAF2135090.1 hypothetical protein K452DRAFT_323232 [Aplosporella prunicola CBS 121167]
MDESRFNSKNKFMDKHHLQDLSPLRNLPDATVTGNKGFLSQQPSISYADDPIFYGDTPFHIHDDKSMGIELAPEKSGWVKYDNK